MACQRINQSITSACRDSQPGLSTLILANKSDLVGYFTNTAGDTITGFTMTVTGKTFYSIALNKQVGSVLDTPTINIPNGNSTCKPKIVGKVQSFSSTVRELYKQLLQADVIAVVKTIDKKLYAVGWDNGLSMSEGSYGTEAGSDGFKGFSFTLEGIESVPFYEISSSLNFESTYVN
jgi:hypothetical protein